MGRKRGRRSPRSGSGASLITGGLSPTLTPSTGDLGTRLRNGWHSSSMLSSPPEPADGGLFDDDDFDDRVDDHHDAHDAPPRSSDDPPHRPPGGGAPLGGGGGGGGPPMSGMLRGSRIPVIVQDLDDHSVGSALGDAAGDCFAEEDEDEAAFATFGDDGDSASANEAIVVPLVGRTFPAAAAGVPLPAQTAGCSAGGGDGDRRGDDAPGAARVRRAPRSDVADDADEAAVDAARRRAAERGAPSSAPAPASGPPRREP